MYFLILALLPYCGIGVSHANDGNDSATETAHEATNGLPFPWSKVRLPNYIVPIHYHLLIHPNLTTLNFSGSVRIEIDVKNNTNWVVLHSKNLKITAATILDESEAHHSEKQLPVLEYPPHEQIAIFSPKILFTGEKYFLQLEFAAPLGDGFYGFYKSTYKTKTGETRVLASTHFEPTSARMAFPCFDEPSFKANYSVRIRRSQSHIALSNMPIEQTVSLQGGLFEDHFEASVRMSTYLVAFIVCDFKSVSGRTASGIDVSIFAVPDKWHQTHYALEAAVKLLEFYEKYFNIYYPLPKQDLIAIPDFQSGAMENWGLTTYRETSLLFDPDTSSASDKLWVTMVIGHELAHQWFGNLVTMEWWNDIWLNEGFARYMEFVSVDATYPELRVEDYLLDTCFAAIGRDSLNSSRPISSAAENPTQIKEMFDTVSYDKGACILHMLRHFLTDDVFQSGIVRYLRRFSYRNAKNEDLWNSIASTCSDEDFTSGEYCYSSGQASKNAYRYAGEHLDLKVMMNTWTLQKGIPLVIVDRQGSALRVRQERFLKTVQPSDPLWLSMQHGYLWHVPLTYKTSNSKNTMRHLLETKSDTLALEGDVSWVKFNSDMNGYYIVHYEGDGWDTLIDLLKENHTALTHKDRVNLIHNAFQLVTAGRLPLSKALDLTGYLKSETHNVPLLQGLGYLETFYKMLEKRNIVDVTQNLKTYILQYFKAVIDKQTWSDTGSVSDRKLRSEVLSLACDLGYLPCVEKAKQLFNSWVKSNSSISLPTDVAETIYSAGAQDNEGWSYLLEIYRVSLSEAEKDKILGALASSKDSDKLSRLLDMGMEGEVIRTQDLSSLIYTVARNPMGHFLAWNFVKKNWNALVEKFQLGSFCIRNILIGTTAQFSSKEELEEIKAFFESVREQSSQLQVTRVAVENVEKNIMWLERNLEPLRTWLQKHLP
ncbi:endoplasmic reticulum aminopeptidase 2-like [Megalops cyprinoides]|uniref:endoplasmic reticulum aminopeptidase 2-like n=1 Tax=Megalops cyprinoides TaxID=118141 RepID=UPI00186513C2|nr:endoplasmic reticulum aminopeptidase 2-like [Megalops cyprinoides]